MAIKPHPKTAFVLAGGGSLGALQVGMLRSLLEHGIEPDLVLGSSVGSINAVFFAGVPTVEGVRALERVWRGLRRQDVFPIGLLDGLLGFLGRQSFLFNPGALRALLERELPVRRLEDAAIPCQVVAADALSGEEVRLFSGDAIEAILASAAIPAIFPPVVIGGRSLMDGGVSSNTPIAAALAAGAERVIVLPTGFNCAASQPPRSALGMLLQAISLLIARQLVVDVERFSGVATIAVVPPLCPLAVFSGDFTRTGELIDRAAGSTRAWLDQGGLRGGVVPPKLRPHEHPMSPEGEVAAAG